MLPNKAGCYCTTWLLGAALLAAMAAHAADTDADSDMLALANDRAHPVHDAWRRTYAGYSNFVFRHVRANFERMSTSYDRIVFCGEMQAAVEGGGAAAWMRFAYIPGDPNILATDSGAMGDLGGVGPAVRHNYCDAPDVRWLPGEFTAAFQP